jgi:hypothetical protein
VIDVLRLRTHGVGPSMVESAFAGIADPKSLSWQECVKVFDFAGGPYSYGLTQHLVEDGWDAHDLVLDLDYLTDAWVREHGSLPEAADERQALAIAVIERLRPRILIDLNMRTFDAPALLDLRRRFPFIERTIGVANVMKRLDRALGHDLVLTPSKRLADLLARRFGQEAEIYHHAFDPVRLRALHAGERDIATVFTGKVGGGDYAERTALVRELLRDGLLEAWVSGELTSEGVSDGRAERVLSGFREHALEAIPLEFLAFLHRATRRGGEVLGLRIRDDLDLEDRRRSLGGSGGPVEGGPVPTDRCHPSVYGDQMFELVGRARALLHHEVNGAATSLRLFETTGMGTALVTNAVDGIEDLFGVGQEVLTYRTLGEARSVLGWLNRDPQAAMEIGAAGQRRTLRDHTVEARARQLSAILHQLDSAPALPRWRRGPMSITFARPVRQLLGP